MAPRNVPRRRRTRPHRASRYGDPPGGLAPAYASRWTELPAPLSVHELTVLAHTFNGYEVAAEHLQQNAWDLAERLGRKQRAHGRWEETTIELLATLFYVVRGWRGNYEYPTDGDENHQEGHSLTRLSSSVCGERPHEVEFRPVEHEV